MLGRHPEPGSDQHRAEFAAVEAGSMRLVVQAWAAARAADAGVVIGHLPGRAEAREAGPARAPGDEVAGFHEQPPGRADDLPPCLSCLPLAPGRTI
jgi:hypothetical protein